MIGNLLKNLFCLFIVLLAFSSCAEEKRYCAECYEYNSGVWASDFCGTSEEVDTYIEELGAAGLLLGQAWSCDKIEE